MLIDYIISKNLIMIKLQIGKIQSNFDKIKHKFIEDKLYPAFNEV